MRDLYIKKETCVVHIINEREEEELEFAQQEILVYLALKKFVTIKMGKLWTQKKKLSIIVKGVSYLLYNTMIRRKTV